MCKMVFIGTDNVLEEIPYDADMPAFSLTKIEGEFLQVADKFLKANIYYVATGRGCGCDFGINSAIAKETNSHLIAGKISSIINNVLMQRTTQNSRLAVQEQSTANNTDFVKDTLLLIDCIESNTFKDSPVELYCCWAGVYAEPADEEITIDLGLKNLKDVFTIEESQKITFIRS